MTDNLKRITQPPKAWHEGCDAGRRVPRKSTRAAKEYVGHMIRQAERRGAKRISAAARRYAKP